MYMRELETLVLIPFWAVALEEVGGAKAPNVLSFLFGGYLKPCLGPSNAVSGFSEVNSDLSKPGSDLSETGQDLSEATTVLFLITLWVTIWNIAKM